MSSSLPPDPYKILGIPRTAQTPEIRNAYKKLVLTCHPDKVQDAALKEEKQEEFQRVQRAYELLTNEAERQKYDDQFNLSELLRERAKTMANTSSPRSATRHYDVRTVDPTRPGSYNSSPHSTPGVPLHTRYVSPTQPDYYMDPKTIFADRTPRRTSSYEQDRAKRDRRREKEEEEDRARRRRQKEEDEREWERERERKVAEKERKARRAEKKHQEEERERRSDKKQQPRHSSPGEYSDDEPTRTPRLEKKSSSSMHRESKREERPIHRESSLPLQDQVGKAMDYISRSRGSKPNLDRSSLDGARFPLRNSPPAVPTPPPAHNSSPFGVPDDDGHAYRSRAAPRRGSHDQHSHKKQHSGLRESPLHEEPMVVPVSPSSRPGAPALSKSTSVPPIVPDMPHRQAPVRASTFQEHSSTRHTMASAVHPGLTRASTYAAPESGDSRGRGRSRYQAQTVEAAEDDLVDDRRHREGRKHRSRRRLSPEEMADLSSYVPPMPTSRHGKKYYHPSQGSQGYTYLVAPPLGRYESEHHGLRVNTAPYYVSEDVAYANYAIHRHSGEVRS